MDRWLKLTPFILVICLGCQRDIAKSGSTLTIQAPQALNSMNKSGGVGALAAMPTNRKACYGVNVSGPGIFSHQTDSCSLMVGMMAGFIEPGEMIELKVPKGEGRRVELYAYLQDPGQNLPCPEFTKSLTPMQVTHIFQVGLATGVNNSGEKTEVEIVASFPGVTNYLAQQLAMPATCSSGVVVNVNRPGFQVSSGQRVATGGTVKLIGRLGRAGPGTTTGGGIRLMTK